MKYILIMNYFRIISFTRNLVKYEPLYVALKGVFRTALLHVFSFALRFLVKRFQSFRVFRTALLHVFQFRFTLFSQTVSAPPT